MNLRAFRRLLLATACLLLITSSLAQDAGTGAISGTVLDPSGAVLPGADLSITSATTHITRATHADTRGVFRIALLPPGLYSMQVVASGFAPRTMRDLRVTVSETASVTVTLAVQQANATVEVSANTEIAQRETSSLGRAVDELTVNSLPLANRNYTQILALSPGVMVALPNASQLGNGSQNVAANGAHTTSNNFQFNGVDANNLAQNSAQNDAEEPGIGVPSPDAIQEFKAQTGNYDAGFGRGSGANVDLVSKSGGNRFHGSAWEFLRNTVLNANDFFVKNSGARRPDLKQNQFGATGGGPLVRDRTFFFVSYQTRLELNGLGGKRTALLPQLTNDRSPATLGAQFCPANHGNGAGYLTHAGGTQVACNGSNINPVALAILNTRLPDGAFAIPAPQVPVTTGSGELPVGRSTFAPPAHYREDQGTFNLDHSLSTRNVLAGRFFYSRDLTHSPFSPNGANVPGWGSDTRDRITMFVLSDTHTFTPHLLNVARFGFMRFDGLLSVESPVTTASVGMDSPTGVVAPTASAPGLTIDGLFTIGDAGTPRQWQVTNSFVYQDTISYTHGRNNWRFGAEYKRHQVALDAPFTFDGLLDVASFPDFLVGLSAAQNGSPIGASNVTQSYAGSGISRKDTRFNDTALFVQDDLKLTPRLTINAGLRYEIFGAPWEIHGLLPNFDPAIAAGNVPTTGSFSGFVLPSNFTGAVPAGYTRLTSRSLWPTTYGDVSPRLGFVWQLTERPTVLLRGGYGIYYDRHSNGYVESLEGQPPFSSQVFSSGTANAAATLAHPFSPLLPAPSAYPVFAPRIPFGFPFLQGISPHTLDGRTHEYNLNTQLAFAHDYLFELGYVGTRSVHRPGSIEFDQALLASPTAPVNGEITNSTNNLIQRLPWQGVSPGSLFNTSDFIANYNSLQSSLTKRFSHGLQFLASYTWSKTLNETSGSGGSSLFELWLPTNDQRNPRQSSYGLSDFDRSQRAVLSFTWQTPHVHHVPSFSRSVLNGWEFAGIGVIQSGSPLTIMDGNAGSVYGNFENRGQRAPGGNASTTGSLFARVAGRYLTPAAFTRAPEAPFGTSLADQDFGNSAVGMVRGPGQHNLDFAIERTFPVAEVVALRFRTEFFNLTNTPQFGNPGTGLGYGDPNDPNPTASASFGRILGTSANPRIIQFALKLSY